MKKHSTRDFFAGILLMALIFSLASPAGAALVGKTIQVLTGVEIYVDGVEMKPTDANGNPVETFVYNGTTYVPLRAVSQSLGYAVNWDGANQRVYIGEQPGQKQYLLSVCPPYQSDHFYTPETISMSGKTYTNCCTFDYFDAFALFNLNGQYQTFSFDIGHIDEKSMVEGTLYIYLDGELAYTMELDPEALPQHRDIPLNGALQMKIQVKHNSIWAPYGMGNMEIY